VRPSGPPRVGYRYDQIYQYHSYTFYPLLTLLTLTLPNNVDPLRRHAEADATDQLIPFPQETTQTMLSASGRLRTFGRVGKDRCISPVIVDLSILSSLLTALRSLGNITSLYTECINGLHEVWVAGEGLKGVGLIIS
jgi:hypothetical protein